MLCIRISPAYSSSTLHRRGEAAAGYMARVVKLRPVTSQAATRLSAYLGLVVTPNLAGVADETATDVGLPAAPSYTVRVGGG